MTTSLGNGNCSKKLLIFGHIAAPGAIKYKPAPAGTASDEMYMMTEDLTILWGSKEKALDEWGRRGVGKLHFLS